MQAVKSPIKQAAEPQILPNGAAAKQAPPLRIGIAGLGTVGAAVVSLLRQQGQSLAQKCGRPIEIAALCARSRAKAAKAYERAPELGAIAWCDNAAALAAMSGIDVFIELMGGEGGMAYEAVKTALCRGRAVITANKALLARHGTELAAIAEQNKAPLYFEAAIAGGIPIVKVLRESLAGNHISRIYGILNGTCNYVLMRMEQGLPFAAALAEAQSRGYAEADPSFDIDGHDTAHKLALLSSLAFGTKTECAVNPCEGIAHIKPADIEAARALGYRIKLLGIAAKSAEGIEQTVRPVMLPASAPMAQISGGANAIMVESAELGELLLSGPGAGGAATASAVIGDIADIAKGGRNGNNAVFGQPLAAMAEFSAAPEQICRGGYFIRLHVRDRLGVFAAVAGLMAQSGISLKSIVQKASCAAEADADAAMLPPQAEKESKAVILITHAARESSVRQALALVRQTGFLTDMPQYIRIEDAACGRG